MSKKEREVISHGFDHQVLKTILLQGEIIKVPWGLNLLLCTLFDCYERVERLKVELAKLEALTDKTQVHVPRTRIFKGRRTYIMAQQFISEDQSVDILDFLAKMDPADLLNYDDKPTNFRSHEGKIYVIDPFQSFASRLVYRTQIISHERYRQVVTVYKKMKQKKFAKQNQKRNLK